MVTLYKRITLKYEKCYHHYSNAINIMATVLSACAIIKGLYNAKRDVHCLM